MTKKDLLLHFYNWAATDEVPTNCSFDKIVDKYLEKTGTVINIGFKELFTVENKKYLATKPATTEQLAEANEHGHLVIILRKLQYTKAYSLNNGLKPAKAITFSIMF